jgi:hypothetical protein
MDPGRQFESMSRPSLSDTFRTKHGQDREGERGVSHEEIERVLREGIEVTDRNRPGHKVYRYTDSKTNTRYKVAYSPGNGAIPTVTKDPGASPEERAAATQQTKDQNVAASQGLHQKNSNKAIQAEKQAQRDWSNKFPGKEFPGMSGYKASKKK